MQSLHVILPSFQTMHTNGYSNNKAHSNKHSSHQGHHCRDSGELDVFEASRYFSVDIDELSFGFERLSCRHAQAFPPQKPNDMKLKDKKHKTRTSSPPSRLASYIISFLLQRSPKSVVHGERLRRRKRRNNISSFYSCGTCGLEESEVCEEKKVINLNWKVGRSKSFDQRFDENHDENKVLSRVQSGVSFENKYVLNKRKDDDGDDDVQLIKGIRRSFCKDDDLESDSSSDLFELSNIDADFQVAQSEVPQVCGGSVKWSFST